MSFNPYESPASAPETPPIQGEVTASIADYVSPNVRGALAVIALVVWCLATLIFVGSMVA